MKPAPGRVSRPNGHPAPPTAHRPAEGLTAALSPRPRVNLAALLCARCHWSPIAGTCTCRPADPQRLAAQVRERHLLSVRRAAHPPAVTW